MCPCPALLRCRVNTAAPLYDAIIEYSSAYYFVHFLFFWGGGVRVCWSRAIMVKYSAHVGCSIHGYN